MRRGRDSEEKKRGLKLCHRICSAKLENPDRFSTSPKLDLLSDSARSQRSVGSTIRPGFQSRDRCRQEWRELRPPRPQFPGRQRRLCSPEAIRWRAALQLARHLFLPDRPELSQTEYACPANRDFLSVVLRGGLLLSGRRLERRLRPEAPFAQSL